MSDIYGNFMKLYLFSSQIQPINVIPDLKNKILYIIGYSTLEESWTHKLFSDAKKDHYICDISIYLVNTITK